MGIAGKVPRQKYKYQKIRSEQGKNFDIYVMFMMYTSTCRKEFIFQNIYAKCVLAQSVVCRNDLMPNQMLICLKFIQTRF